ncbi:MAG: hypothetical protein RIT45_2104 [Pseudomonadota bacterium]|jgi:hypothetical protein
MARFSGEHHETFRLEAPPERAAAHFGDLDMITRHYGPIERAEQLDADTLRLTLQDKGMKGIRYQARYTVRYERTPGLLRWRTIESDNLWSEGEARFSAEGTGTRVDYRQRIETEIPVPRLLAKMAEGIVRNEIVGGVQAYLGRMRAACPRA